MTHTYIIAEAGVNHNGSFSLAKKLVDAAKRANADAVKFQTFKAENLVTKTAKQAEYQIENLGESSSQFEMLKSLELTYQEFVDLKQYCDDSNIEFLSTPFDYDSVDFLIDQLGLETMKIPSGELTNSPFVHYIATKRPKIILSTGMANIEEIHTALQFIAYGLAFPSALVDVQEVHNFYSSPEAKALLKKYVTILHCTTEYPAPFETINLKAMNHLKEETGLQIGFSDHSKGISVPIAAVALGATVIEKHFTLDRTMEGPDHIASLEPFELKEMVKCIREIELSLGTGVKKPADVELKNMRAARKSLVATSNIKKGEIFTTKNLGVKRPGNGMSPNLYWSLLGEKSSGNYEEDELINE